MPKKTKDQDPATLAPAELKNELGRAVAHRAQLEFQHRVSALKDPMELGRVRRQIARLKMFIRRKEAAK
ncbi:MAG: 50S ribosomal protein L29 [Elusimicrobia bacterium]|nr:50S ribosomal protein L29 [Elusimicrobiota bacterium]